MRLVDKIGSLLRAGLSMSSPDQPSPGSRKKRSGPLQAEVDRVNRGLEMATAREKDLENDLALALEEGREKDAVRIRRQLAEIRQSAESLRVSLDLVQARIEAGAGQIAAPIEAKTQRSVEEQAQHWGSLEDRPQQETKDAPPQNDPDLEARKERLNRKPPTA